MSAVTPDGVETFLNVAEDLVPSRSDELQPTISLDFKGLLDPPLLLKQDVKEGCGGKTWPAGVVLAEYLLRCKLHTLRDKTMFVSSKILCTLRSTNRNPEADYWLQTRRLELGSGSGLVGYVYEEALA